MENCLIHNTKCIEQLINKIVNDKVAFFVGAAISSRKPALLPAAWELKINILRALNPDKESKSRYTSLLQQLNNDLKSPEAERLSKMMMEHILHIIDEIDINPD